MFKDVSAKCTSILCCTWNTSVDDPEELFVAARVTEECRVDGHGAASLAGTGAVQREMYVDVTVPRVGHIALGSYQGVIATVACTVEHYQLVGRTDDLQDRVETDELVETAVRSSRQRPHRICIILRCIRIKSRLFDDAPYNT